MTLHGWGNYPIFKGNILEFKNSQSFISEFDPNLKYIPYGNGRSYGDSAISSNQIYMKNYNYFISFDEEKGILHCRSGVMLSDILNVFVKRGWFLKVTPGTKYITVGGAIASDVHGKNHHINGCFSECVEEISLLLPEGKVIKCSRYENTDFFHATCGGMGLTGIILDAKIKLLKIKSRFIDQMIFKTKNLKETFHLFEKYKNHTYSVAWIDCLAENQNTGRSVLMFGEHANDFNLDYNEPGKISVPFYFPNYTLNSKSVKAFNWLYYHKARCGYSKTDIDSFFYPLDAILNWNRIYGKKGFLQYQFVLPLEKSYEGLIEILKMISKNKKGSFLAVLKLFGKENSNWISFPMEGYTLALDFKIEDGIFEFLKLLDRSVLKYGGRFYLSKDARMSKETFEPGYENIDKFRSFRKKYGFDVNLNSLQSERLFL